MLAIWDQGGPLSQGLNCQWEAFWDRLKWPSAIWDVGHLSSMQRSSIYPLEVFALWLNYDSILESCILNTSLSNQMYVPLVFIILDNLKEPCKIQILDKYRSYIDVYFMQENERTFLLFSCVLFATRPRKMIGNLYFCKIHSSISVVKYIKIIVSRNMGYFFKVLLPEKSFEVMRLRSFLNRTFL